MQKRWSGPLKNARRPSFLLEQTCALDLKVISMVCLLQSALLGWLVLGLILVFRSVGNSIYNVSLLVGVNCHFDPFVSLEALKKMKAGLDAADLHPYLMCQPLAYHTPDAGKQGFIDLPEFPFALEPRICTR